MDQKPEKTPSRRPDRGDKSLDDLKRLRRNRATRVVVILAVLILLIVFVLRNSQPVPIDFLVTTRSPRLIWIMLGCAVLGGIVGFALGRPSGVPLRKDAKKERGSREG